MLEKLKQSLGSWNQILNEELSKPYFQALEHFLKNEANFYPKKEWIFRAFELTPYQSVRVVIVGQDPYHGKGQAEGLAFSVPDGVGLPPSLKNIFREIQDDVGVAPSCGSLVPWAEQGVFLLNTTLTVQKGEPLSHRGKGWELFTDAVIKKLCEREEPLVFLLWGRHAEKKRDLIPGQHLVLTAAHPSPFSARRGFFGCRHFSKVNAYLKSPIDWST